MLRGSRPLLEKDRPGIKGAEELREAWSKGSPRLGPPDLAPIFLALRDYIDPAMAFLAQPFSYPLAPA